MKNFIGGLICGALLGLTVGLLLGAHGEIVAVQRCDEMISKRPVPRGNAPKVIKKPKEISKCLNDNGSIKNECIGGMGSDVRSN